MKTQLLQDKQTQTLNPNSRIALSHTHINIKKFEHISFFQKKKKLLTPVSHNLQSSSHSSHSKCIILYIKYREVILQTSKMQRLFTANNFTTFYAWSPLSNVEPHQDKAFRTHLWEVKPQINDLTRQNCVSRNPR